jgi:hypothetical protein
MFDPSEEYILQAVEASIQHIVGVVIVTASLRTMRIARILSSLGSSRTLASLRASHKLSCIFVRRDGLIDVFETIDA